MLAFKWVEARSHPRLPTLRSDRMDLSCWLTVLVLISSPVNHYIIATQPPTPRPSYSCAVAMFWILTMQVSNHNLYHTAILTFHRKILKTIGPKARWTTSHQTYFLWFNMAETEVKVQPKQDCQIVAFTSAACPFPFRSVPFSPSIPNSRPAAGVIARVKY